MQSDSPQPDYNLFLKWFEDNGGRKKNIKFPSYFGPMNYVGVAAEQCIKANQVIMAVPKKLTIGVSMVRQSELGKIFGKYQILSDLDNQQTDFNILALFLIWQKQLGKQSFYYPYLQSLQPAQTILNWSKEDIQKLNEPTISPSFIEYIGKDFPEVFEVFVEISVQNSELFKEIITWESFIGCYSIVMTRCFGWGLPETMIVPFADFFNHNCSGVHHYIFNKKLQYADHQSYIKKSEQLDLQILEINNKKKLPTSYARNQREYYLYKHKDILKKLDINYAEDARLDNSQTRSCLQKLQLNLLSESYNVPLFPSSDSEDNDSDEDDKQLYKQQTFIKKINTQVKKQLDPVFEEPKPYVNRQFLDGVDLSWWDEENDDDSYFIVSSASNISKGEQIFNSYGRRSNRFLLVWYGFTLFHNKYDSIPFRILNDEVSKKTGQLVYVQHLIAPFIVINGLKFGYESLSQEYRLKKSRVCYTLMAFLRRKIINKSQRYRDLYNKKLLTLHHIQNFELEKSTMEAYEQILKQLNRVFNCDAPRQKIYPQHKDYFAHLLIKSNRQILQAHQKSMKLLKQIIINLEKGMSLIDAYQYEYSQDQKNLEIKIENRRHILDYFKMLGKSNIVKSANQN